MKPSSKTRKHRAVPPKKRAQPVHVMPAPETRSKDWRSWSAKDDEKLRSLYPRTETSKIATILGRSESAVGSRANDLGLRKELKHRMRRTPGVKPDINIRFATPEDYARIKSAAAALDETMNLFITTAALNRAKVLDVLESPPIAEAVGTIVS